MNNNPFFKITVIVLFSCIILVWVFNNYLANQNQEKIELKIDTYLTELNDLVNKNKNLIMTVAVILSKEQSIKKCLKTNNRNNCLEYLNKMKETLLNTYLFDDLKIHIHDKNLKSFYRLWDPKKQNDSLVDFRNSLKIVKKNKSSISCIEIGRYSMLIRGISPIIDDGFYLGSMEAIINFSSLIDHFKEKGIELYILMDKKYKNIASKVEFKKEQILKNYILLNETNKDISFLYDEQFNGTNYKKKDFYYLVNTPIYDVFRNIIGYYVLKIYI